MAASEASYDDSPPDPTLQNVLDQRSLKWIFVGGKGGVGKTTTSCSLAVQLAAVRESVLIISTDPAHNLSDAFRQKFTSKPTLVEGFTNLSAMEVDPTLEVPDDADGIGSFLGEISGSIPGIDEAMSFAEVLKRVQAMDFETVVFDTAPTGHTLRLLQFPTALEKGLGKVADLRDSYGGMIGQVSRLLGGLGGGPDGQSAADVLDALGAKMDTLRAVVADVNAQFKDADITTFVAVCIPEFLSLYETERLIQELARHSIDCRNIVINQVIWPGSAGDSTLMRARARMQRKYLDQFDELYEDFHIVRMPLLEEEVRGIDGLKAFARNLLEPYQAPEQAQAGDAGDAGLARRADDTDLSPRSLVPRLRARIHELEEELARLKASA